MEPGAPEGMRVLHIMESTIGGTRRHITDVARGMQRRGVDVHLAVAAERQESFRQTLAELAQEGCTIHEIPMRRSIAPLSDLSHLLQLRTLLREVRPDIVHTHSSKAGVIGRLAARLTGIGKRVHTPHTFAFLFREMFSGPKRRFFFQLEKQLAGMSDCIVAVSESEASTFRECGVVPADKVRVVPNGIDPAPFAGATPADLGALGLDPTRPTAAVIGLLNVAKGQDLAIEALASREELSALQLLIVGHGEMEQELKALAAERGVQERVAFAGFREDIPEILVAVDFLLLPSRWEGLPYIVLEAMASARGVLATPVDGASDLLREGQTGWFAEQVSSEALAAALVRVLALDVEQRAVIGLAARDQVLTGFSDGAMVEGLLELYASLLDPARP